MQQPPDAPPANALRRARIAVLGSVNMDLAVRTPQLPAPGETVLGHGFRTTQGGKGANQAVAAARAGAEVTMIGAVGTDLFAAELVDALQADGIATDRLRWVDGPSGIAVITVDDAAENTIVVASGANGRLTGLTREDEDVVPDCDLLIMQLEVPLDIVVAGARAAAAAGVAVLLNPSPARTLPADLLADVTVLVVNEGEAAVLGLDTQSLAAHVVTTLGARGARYRAPDGSTVEVGAPGVDPVDTTGAGDALTGSFAVAWAEAAPAGVELTGAELTGAELTGAGLTGAGRTQAGSTGVGPDTSAPAGNPARSDPTAVGAMLRWACAAGAFAATVAGAGESAPRRADIDRFARAEPARPENTPG